MLNFRQFQEMTGKLYQVQVKLGSEVIIIYHHKGGCFFTFCALSWNQIRDTLLTTTTVHTFRRINLYLSCYQKKKKTKQNKK